ncbi:insulin-like peptide receptor [Macrosteles quadrilineatus]|uniref:insulin-like peptide receptor n=1 Tax=Macrosteles quadrilineatus TaxID=74068 RepID=UPI0023E1D517|nr:insulin-like peptide receptor [Macrosteles quadrilineatus]XP_054263487.1 insulin-like peptide receptor [Macrosteles quadrilineatus]
MNVNLLFVLLGLLRSSSGRICHSINIRNDVSNLEKLANCTVVEGYVQIVLIERATEQDFEPWSLPELREITQYLLFYRVKGLRNLGKLFPNLVRIGGSSLFIDYGLVIHEMFSLQEVGLASLQEISRGSVIITKNPSLCYVNTINWELIAKWDPIKNYVAKNKDPSDCPGCQAECPHGLCWSRTECQIQPESPHCYHLCVGGCSAPGPRGCHSCRRVLTHDGECVENCPHGTYQYLNRRCIKAVECTSIDLPKGPPGTDTLRKSSSQVTKYFVFNGTCTDNCPPGYEFDAAGTTCVPCKGGKCHKWCHGLSIENIGDAEMLRGCTHIQGSLEISIRTGKPKRVFEELEENLGSIEEIENYLKVVRSFPIINLKFLKNLTVIHGRSSDAGFGDNYSLLVLENHNLQELWDWDTKHTFNISKGKVFFHYNPKLCLQHIHKLLSVIHHDENVTNLEVGKDSNGDKFPCNATEINIKVVDRSHSSIQIRVPYLQINYDTTILRYVVYYTKAPFKNMTMFDDLDQCSDYGWKTKDIAVDPYDKSFEENGFIVELNDLEPYTQYAFYVTTYTIDRFGAKSSISYETTLPSTPSEIARLEAFSNKSSEIFLQWEPPKYINGKFEKYVITLSPMNYDETPIRLRNYCDNPLDHRNEVESYKPRLLEAENRQNNSCCSTKTKKLIYTPKEGLEKHCSNHDYCKLPMTYFDKDPLAFQEYFESCFYSYIYEDPFVYVSSETNITSLKRQERNLSADNKLSLNYGTYNVYTADVKATSSNFTITNLLHFQDYLIKIKACRYSQYPNEPDSLRCSKTDVVTVRTKKDEEADRITGHLTHEVVNGTVFVSWIAPPHPNGLIVAFEVEHGHTVMDNMNPIVSCITLSEYENNRRRYSIVGLAEGTYKVRVRAISLAGKGPYSKYIRVEISSRLFSAIKMVIGFFVLCIIMILVSIALMSYMRKKTMLDDILVASVNPDYQYIQDEWEVSRDDIEIVDELGVGAFGKVYKGILIPSNLSCAVKTVNDDASSYETFLFLSEASVMKSVSKAYHIVHLLGVVSIGHPPLVIMELMSLGDLKTYLRSTRDTNPPTNAVMINMALQIADGMAYMEAKKFVHRDLAARNCMVNQDCVVKVGDFGMTRDIYETDYYRKINMGLLPIRWMPPESLQDGIFTSQSDVWSYGVVLWEIVTLAEQPYQGSSNDQVLNEVIAGRKLETPRRCPETLRNIMLCCWKRKPSQRMTFMQIVTSLEYYHDQEFKNVSFYHTQEAQDLRKSSTDYEEMQSVEDPLLGIREDYYSNIQSFAMLLTKVKSYSRDDEESGPSSDV